MKKLFLLIPVLVLSLAMNAADQYPNPEVTNSLSAAISAVGDNEVIYLDEGTYFNAYGVDYTQPRNGKHYTIRAIEGKKPVVKLVVPFRIREAASAKFIGIKFDGSAIDSRYDWYFKAYDNTANVLEFEDCEFTSTAYYIIQVPSGSKLASLKLKNCNFHDNTNRGIINQGTIDVLQVNDTKFTNFTNASYCSVENYGSGTIGSAQFDGCEFANSKRVAIYGSGSSHIDKFVVNNCYFHDSQRSAIFFEAPGSAAAVCDSVFITNSTFAKISNTNDFWASIIDIRNGGSQTKLGYVLVDHCTFYDCTTINTDHVAVRIHKSTDATISNCIFYDPNQSADVTESKRAATNLYGGNVKNCVTYNYLYTSDGHVHNGATYTSCSNANPLFNDLANNKYTYDGNWETMSLSPARGAGTDGSDLGDPRWYSAEVLPSTDFASPYQFVGSKAQITGNIWYNGTNDYLYYNNKSECGTATWKIHATRARILGVILNMNAGTSTQHQFKVEILDAEGTSIGYLTEASSVSTGGDIIIPGTITLPSAGDYTVKLYNLQSWSSAKIDGITLGYLGGETVDVPGTLNGEDALLVSKKMYRTENGEIHYDDNSTPGNEYAYWKINVTKAQEMEVRLNVVADPNKDSQSGHQFSVSLYSSSDFSGDPIQTVSEASSTSHTGTIVLPTKMNFTSTGTYYIKLDNTKQYSSAILGSIRIVYVGGAVVDVPGVLNGEDAVLVDTHMTRADNGDIQYGDNGNPSDEYAYWKIHATEAYSGKIILNIPTENNGAGHEFHVSLYSSLDGDPISEAFETETSWSSKPIELSQTFDIPSSGDYFIRLDNATQWSSAILRSIIIATNISNIDESETNINTVIGANDGKAVNVQLKRSLTGGMYNTICLPFAVSAAEMARVFPGATVKELTSSSIEGGGFVLNLNFEAVDEMEAGVPYIIMPASDITNPKFIGVTIDNTLNNIETSNADFIGNFVVDQIPASEDNLFLGASSTLYFPTVDMEIKGLRAYFQVKNPSGAPIRSARIVEQGNVATEIEIAQPDAADKTDKSNVTKRIENGQLLIIRESVQYNALGVRVK